MSFSVEGLMAQAPSAGSVWVTLLFSQQLLKEDLLGVT